MTSQMKVFTFSCKFVASAQQVLAQVHRAILGRSAMDSHVGENDAQGLAAEIKSALRSNGCSHHVFVFHKTETLRTAGEDYAFLTFLSDLVGSNGGTRVRITAIFTAYKPFPVIGENFKTLQVDMLTDPLDILTILEHYAPGSNGRDYVFFCQRILPLPEAVRRVAEEYLSPGSRRLQCAQQRDIICRDGELMSLIFHKRAKEVKSWIGNSSDYNVISHIVKCSQGSILNEDSVEEAYKRTNRQHDQEGGFQCFKRLVKKYLLLQSSTMDSLFVHPLAFYYFNGQGVLVPTPAFDDHSSNSYTQFLCRVLMKTDQAMLTIGSDTHVFGCRAQDWLHTKTLLEVAVHSATGGYRAFFKVAVVARQLLMSIMPNEAKQFYSVLVRSAKCYGTSSQSAVMEACLAMTTTLANDVDWKSADEYFESSIRTLRTQGPAFFYSWALRKRAITLHRRGYQLRSLETFKEAKMISPHLTLNSSPSDDLLEVPEWQKQEDLISAEIHESIPLIFTGDNLKARKKLLTLRSSVQDIRQYPDYGILLNSIGLTYERGESCTGDQDFNEALNWYKKSYNERKFLEKISPGILTIPMNNIGMVSFQLGQYNKCEQYLQKVIAVERKTERQHFNTALTLFNLGRVKWAKCRAKDAYDHALEALAILQKKCATHYLTLVIQLALAHIRLTLGQSDARDDKSPLEYLEALAQHSNGISKGDTNEEQHCIMSYHEHNIVVHWLNSLEAFSFHKSRLCSQLHMISHKHPSKAPVYLQLESRWDFLNYIERTRYEHLDYDKLMNHLISVCQYCQIIRSVYRTAAWTQCLSRPPKEHSALGTHQPSFACQTSRVSCLEFPSMTLDCNHDASHGLRIENDTISRLTFSNQTVQTVDRQNSCTLLKSVSNANSDEVTISPKYLARCVCNVQTKSHTSQKKELVVQTTSASVRRHPSYKLSLLRGNPIAQTSDTTLYKSSSQANIIEEKWNYHELKTSQSYVEEESGIKIYHCAQTSERVRNVREICPIQGSPKNENIQIENQSMPFVNGDRNLNTETDYTDLPELVSMNSAIVQNGHIQL